jgi:hypothetical protein
MRLEHLVYLLEKVCTSHTEGVKFFYGLEKDYDSSSSKNYPAMIYIPEGATSIITPNQYQYTYNLNFLFVDLLPVSRTPKDIANALDKMQQIANDILTYLRVEFGQSSFLYEGETIKTDFELTNLNWIEVIDDGSENFTGWAVTATIETNEQFKYCDVKNRFEITEGLQSNLQTNL